MSEHERAVSFGSGLSAALDLDDLLAEMRRRAAGAQFAQDRLALLLDAVVAIGSDLEFPVVLDRIIESARGLVGARYGALGVLGQGGDHLSEFVAAGVPAHVRVQIGHAPIGHGVLGLLLSGPHAIRLDDLSTHPSAYGVPPGHPEMTSFLGVPVRVRGTVFGNLYLCDKEDGTPFTEDDEKLLTALAAAAGIAIENAQLYRRAQHHQQWASAIGDLTQTLLEGRHERLALARMVKHARELGEAELGLLAVPGEDGALVVTVVESADGAGRSAGKGVGKGVGKGPGGGTGRETIGRPLNSKRWAQVLAERVPLLLISAPDDDRVGELSWDLRRPLGLPPEGACVVVPITVGEVEVGIIALLWSDEGQERARDVLEMLTTFGEQMGLAVEAARAQRDRARTTLLEDRDRIARDMHDHVIQRLFAAGLSLQSAARISEEPVRGRINAAVDELDAAVKEIRQTIFALHETIAAGGLGPEIELLVERSAEGFGFVPDVRFDGLLSDVPADLVPDVVAVVREGLTNSVRHARATDAEVQVSTLDDLVITVRDNGIGTPPDAARSGLVNLAERARAHGGEFEVNPRDPKGTELVWRIPLPPHHADTGRRRAQLG